MERKTPCQLTDAQLVKLGLPVPPPENDPLDWKSPKSSGCNTITIKQATGNRDGITMEHEGEGYTYRTHIPMVIRALIDAHDALPSGRCNKMTLESIFPSSKGY